MLIQIENWQLIPEVPEILIIDDFYDQTDWILPSIKTLPSLSRDDVNYGGSAFKLPENQLNYSISKISQILGLDHLNQERCQSELRLTLKKDENSYRTFIHADPSLNVLVYLSGEEGINRGTRFYRHRELGMSFVHASHPRQKMMNLLLETFDTKDLSKWELIKEVPFKSNRAIIFNGHYFHATPESFYGESAENGRITQNLFFNNLKDFYLKGSAS